jgi:hypothetical protein
MTRILDVDLDIFVTPISQFHSDTRLRDEEYDVVDIETVKRFMEVQCGLCVGAPKPGGVFEEHDELFSAIKSFVQEGRIQTPIDLVHVDAHADLALGQWAPISYLLRDLMHRPAAERLDPILGSGGLNRGSVILFLVATEWLKSLGYVHHPDDGNDFREFFLEYEMGRDELEHPDFEQCRDDPRYQKMLAEAPTTGQSYFHIPRLKDPKAVIDLLYVDSTVPRISEKGRRIPFNRVPWREFNDPGFDFVFVTRSPGFTPPSADAVFELLCSYVAQ